jgi:simple sugar transport system permease protein
VSVAIGTSEEHWIRRLGETRSVAIYGIALGILAFWLSLPPWDVRFEGGPIALGIAGALCGLWAVTRDEQKLGWWAISIAIAGTGAALWAQTKSTDSLDAVVNAGLFAATLRFATPLAFAAMGGIFSERSGVVNIALEGMMLSGAFFGIWAAAWSGSWVVGILMAMVFGGLLALIHAFFSIHLRADQIVSGTAINFLAIGLTGYLFRYIYGTEGTPSDVSRVPRSPSPGSTRSRSSET